LVFGFCKNRKPKTESQNHEKGMKNKRTYFILWFVAGSLCGGQAINYFMSGAARENSYLINFLVLAQLLFGIGIAFYGWKKFRLMGDSKS
jgi:hypothetical protein